MRKVSASRHLPVGLVRDCIMIEADRRQLKIKAGSVNRLKKELGLYAKERGQERQRVDRLKQNGADAHDLKHAAS